MLIWLQSCGEKLANLNPQSTEEQKENKITQSNSYKKKTKTKTKQNKEKHFNPLSWFMANRENRHSYLIFQQFGAAENTSRWEICHIH